MPQHFPRPDRAEQNPEIGSRDEMALKWINDRLKMGNMNWNLLGPMLVTLAVAIGGWFIGHLLAAKRDRKNKIRELRVNYLIEAYRRMESCANRGRETDTRQLESAVADIQLFGTPRQVKLVQNFISEFAEKRNASMDELLQELRHDLREELQLDPVLNQTLHLRWTLGKDDAESTPE